MLKEFITMKKNALKPSPNVGFEEHFHLHELEQALLENPGLTRNKVLAKQVAQATLIGRQASILINHALETGQALKTENQDAMVLLMKIHAYALEMQDSKSMILAKQEQMNQQFKGQFVEFVQLNRPPKHRM